MTYVELKTDEAVLDKLKKLDVLSETKKESDLEKLVFKKIDKNGNIISYPCKVLGFNWKFTGIGCINDIFQEFVVKVEDEIFNIHIAYLKEMQSKDWGIKKEEIEEEL